VQIVKKKYIFDQARIEDVCRVEQEIRDVRNGFKTLLAELQSCF